MSNFLGNMGIDVGIVIIFLILVVIAMIFVTMRLHYQVTRLNRKYRAFMRGSDGQSLEKVFQRKFAVLDKMVETDENHAAMINSLKSVQDTTMNKYGIVKYDAFEDVGGKLSFAFAMLDKSDTGIVLNAVHSRENCFLYIKEIVKGESYIMLSDEEIEALRQAKANRE